MSALGVVILIVAATADLAVAIMMWARRLELRDGVRVGFQVRDHRRALACAAGRDRHRWRVAPRTLNQPSSRPFRWRTGAATRSATDVFLRNARRRRR